jgi:hypothetical protein
MSSSADMTDQIPPAALKEDQIDDIWLYGVHLNAPVPDPPPANYRHRILVYGFCFQGHCYRLSIPAEYVIKHPVAGPEEPVGCGYDGRPGYHRWRIERSTDVMRVERRKGKAEDLILDFNLPGRSPAAMTYSAKVQIASKAGKIHE